MKKRTRIENDLEQPELLASEIQSVARAAERLFKSRLKLKTICLLIQTNIPQAKRPTLQQIELVLTSARDLEKNNLNKPGTSNPTTTKRGSVRRVR